MEAALQEDGQNKQRGRKQRDKIAATPEAGLHSAASRLEPHLTN